MKLNQRVRLEIAVYISVAALAVPAIIASLYLKNPVLQNLLLNIGAAFLSVAFLFFLVNRFFGINENGIQSDKIEHLIQLAERKTTDLIDENEARNRFLLEKLITSCEELDAVSFNLTDFLITFWALIVERVKQGAKIRLIVIDPASCAYPVIDKNSPPHKPFDQSIHETLTRVQKIQKILAQEKKLKGSFEFKLTCWIPSCGLIIVNPKSKTKCGVMKISIHSPHYSTPHDESNLNIVLSQIEQSRWYDYFLNQFEKLWQEAYLWNGNIPN